MIQFSALIYLLAAYILGSVSTASIIGSVKGVDLSREGTGNPGAANVYRLIGTSWGILTGLLDIVKGIIPVFLAGYLNFNQWIVILAAFAVISGHNWPLFARSRGGRGLATSLGTMVVMAFWPGLIALVLGGTASWLIKRITGRLVRIAFITYPLFIFLLLLASARRELLFYGAGVLLIGFFRAWQRGQSRGVTR